MIKPFSETALFELGNETDPYYATGSAGSIGETPGSFSSALSSKEQVRLSFSVLGRSQMPPDKSSIYYFNKSSGLWNRPSKATGDYVGPINNVSVKTNLTLGSVYFEDAVGFDHRGNAVASGSLPIQRNMQGLYAQKTVDSYGYIGPVLDRNAQNEYMTRDFPKSVQRNPDYDASSSETFTLPIDKPFLIEKVVFEIPFCFGNGWFYDKTSLNFASSSAGDYTKNGSPIGGFVGGYPDPWLVLDQGGPGVTVSLFSQKSYGTGSIRDLVCDALISHSEDLVKEIKLTPLLSGGYSFSPYNFLYWILSPSGISSSEVETVVKPTTIGSNKFFTGSIVTKTAAKITNGVSAFVLDLFGIFSLPTSAELIQWVTNKASSEYVSDYGTLLNAIDPFGRGMTGFSPSGGSIFGGEYATDQVALRQDGSLKNEFYIADSTARAAQMSALAPFLNQSPTTIISLSNVYYKASKASPYLAYPGEKFILAASKTRPAFKNMKIDINTVANADAETKGIGTLLSSSYFNSIPCTAGLNGHDVQFNTGTINITFYGSYVRAGNSYIP